MQDKLRSYREFITGLPFFGHFNYHIPGNENVQIASQTGTLIVATN